MGDKNNITPAKQKPQIVVTASFKSKQKPIHIRRRLSFNAYK